MTFKVTREGELAGRGELVKINSISRSIPKPPASSTTRRSLKKEQKLHIFAVCAVLISAACASQKMFAGMPRNRV
jgi:hypothetical protein